MANILHKRWKGYMSRSRAKIFADETGDYESPSTRFASQKTSAKSGKTVDGEIRGDPTQFSLKNEHKLDGSPTPGKKRGYQLMNSLLSFFWVEIIGEMGEVRSRRLMHPPKTPQREKSRGITFESHDVLPDATTVDKLIYNRVSQLDVMIDRAAGLPLTTTITRIQAKLYNTTKECISTASSYNFSELTSDHTNPQYTLRMLWKGKPRLFISFLIEMSLKPCIFNRRNAESVDDDRRYDRHVRSSRVDPQNNRNSSITSVRRCPWDATNGRRGQSRQGDLFL